EAVQAFVDPIQKALSCVTRGVVDVKGGYYPSADEPHELVLGAGRPVPLRGASQLALLVRMRYRVLQARPPRGRWAVSSVGYQFALVDQGSGKELLAYHWHPDGVSHVTTP